MISRQSFGAAASLWGVLKGLLLAGYLFSGDFKSIPAIKTAPVDLTLLLGGVIVVFILGSVLTNRFKNPNSLGYVLLLYFLCAIPLLWTHSGGYPAQKSFRMFTVTLLASIAPFFLLRKKQDVEGFYKSLILFALITGIDTIIRWRGGEFESARAFSFIREIALGKMMGIGSLWFFIRAILERRAKRVFSIAMGAVFILLLVGAGARMPFFAFVLTVFVVLFAIRKRIKHFVYLPIAMGVIAAVSMFAIMKSPSGSRQRIGDLVTAKTDLASTIRPRLFKIAIENMGQYPQGVGWGGYEELFTGSYSQDVNRIYPHNLILEAFIEGGWAVGVYLCLLLGFVTIKGWQRIKEDPSVLTVFAYALMIFLLISAMYSNDWNDNRDLFAVISIGIMTARIRTSPKTALIGPVAVTSGESL